MHTAILQLAEDFLTAIAFVVVYLLTDNPSFAVGIAIVIGIGQFALLRLRGRTIDVMQWLSFGLVIALGSASLALNDPRFVMMKPSAVHFAIAAVMLRRGWLNRYMPPIVSQNVPERAIIATGYAWAGLMVALGVVNIYIASSFSIATWAWWISVGAIGAKVIALALQFVVFRILIRRNLPVASLAL
jgi:intracellular septation protein